MDDITKSRRIDVGQPSLEESFNVPVFYWRTDCGVRGLPRKGTTVTETSEFIVVVDAETGKEEALHKEDYIVSTELSRVQDIVFGYIEHYETDDCQVVFSDEQMNELKDFLKLVINND